MKKLLFLLLLPLAMQAQPLVEKTPPDYIKTIIFKANGNDKNILEQLKSIYGALSDSANFQRVKKLLGE